MTVVSEKPKWGNRTIFKNCSECNKLFSFYYYRKSEVSFCSNVCRGKNSTLSKLAKSSIGKSKFSKLMKKSWKTGAINAKHCTGDRNYRWKGGALNKTFLNNKRRMILAGVSGEHTLDQWEDLKKQFNYMCLCCKRFEPEIKLSIDHIIPISRGGSNDISNIQPLCRSCNSKKSAKTINYKNI